MHVGDIYFYRDDQRGFHRFWEIKSICLGGLRQESLIELQSLTHSPGEDTAGVFHKTTWVPEALLRNMPCYHKAGENG